MNQVPTSIWNEIAQEQKLATKAATMAFALTPSQMDAMADLWGNELPNKVALGLQLVTPLWLERMAIARYLASNPERSPLRQVLVAVSSAEEAAGLAAREYSMPREQTQLLTQLLRTGRAETMMLEAAIAASKSESAPSAPPNASK